ncbi:MAG: tRNA 2-selenouridine(34) synthase MnmH, partial [Limnobacter sp.]|nr:tRNA 2-selenouridine(34) synthase MnmH [Limnobacter sp.]
GGYKAYRKYVVQQLKALPAQFEFRVVCGETGSGKSRLLETLARCGEQVLDLEALACHKGSVLGGLPEQPQPSQKMFESLVWNALRTMNPDKPVYIEAESKKIGRLRTPEFLFERMTQSRELVRVEVDLNARVEFLLRDYDYFVNDPEALKIKLAYLKTLHGWRTINEWVDLIDQKDWHSLVAQLLTQHYDPAYRKSMNATYPQLQEATTLTAGALNDRTYEAWVKQLQAVSEVN